MSMVGELNYFLGLQVKQWEDGIFIFQEKYAKNLSLDSKKHTSTPMSSSAKLSCDAAREEVDPTFYRSMISSLLYLTASKPDIAFNVGVCAQFQAAPKESHLIAVKQIIRYINGTSDYGITQDTMCVFCENTSAINLSKNLDRKSTRLNSSHERRSRMPSSA